MVHPINRHAIRLRFSIRIPAFNLCARFGFLKAELKGLFFFNFPAIIFYLETLSKQGSPGKFNPGGSLARIVTTHCRRRCSAVSSATQRVSLSPDPSRTLSMPVRLVGKGPLTNDLSDRLSMPRDCILSS